MNATATAPVNPSQEIHCWQCGEKHHHMAKICVHCGCEPLHLANPRPAVTERTGKDKAISVLLAACFSYWTFLYTWREDRKKFVAALLISIFLTPALVIGPLMAVNEAPLGERQIVQAIGILITMITYVFSPGIWLSSLICVCRRNADWYAKYDERA